MYVFVQALCFSTVIIFLGHIWRLVYRRSNSQTDANIGSPQSQINIQGNNNRIFVSSQNTPILIVDLCFIALVLSFAHNLWLIKNNRTPNLPTASLAQSIASHIFPRPAPAPNSDPASDPESAPAPNSDPASDPEPAPAPNSDPASDPEPAPQIDQEKILDVLLNHQPSENSSQSDK